MNRVLIVDDKEENACFLQALLSGNGLEVETARHGAEALAKARKQPPDLVISDLLMPVMDGYTLLRHWRDDARLGQIPFIVYTDTYTDPEDERLALRLGADDFILKTAEPEEILKRIEKVRHARRDGSPSQTGAVAEEEEEILKNYSETLIRKLEQKMLQLERTNRALEEDIKERERTQMSLRESEDRFQRLLDSVPSVAVQGYQLDGTILYWNEASEKFYGYTKQEALGRNLVDLIIPDDMKTEVRARLTALKASEHYLPPEELNLLRKDGTLIPVLSCHTLLHRPGLPTELFCIDIDLTDRKKLEQQFLRAQRMESIGTLAGGIAHDLNNLLSPIIMGIDLLRHYQLDPKLLPVIENISQSATRGASLVGQVLSFARGVEGARVSIRIQDLISDVESIVINTFPKSIVFKKVVPDDLWTVAGDPTQLNQVLLNLCVNARDAMPHGGELTIRARNLNIDEHYASMDGGAPAGPYVLLEVADHGGGMPPEVRDRVFEPFYSTKPPGQGTGLGLSTALGIVRSHGGFVKVYSELGRGSGFKVHLPVETCLLSDDSEVRRREPTPRGQGERILLVDDEISILAVTKQTLEAFGYRVLTAQDGAHAIALYAEHRETIALVVTDMMMPLMDGPALITAIRRLDPQMPIVAASGLGANGAEDRALRAGAKHFVNKPYSADAMLRTIRAALGASAEESGATTN